jgi:3'(2'), 5'-bisphosphate nucleotidase
MNREDLLEASVDAVCEAVRVCRRVRRRLVGPDALTKDDRSPVTVADFAAQALICRRLAERFPGVPVVGEEDTRALREEGNRPLLEKVTGFLDGWDEQDVLKAIDRGGARPQGRFFTLDPIDGTKGFLRGDHYAVALALLEEEEPVMAVLGCPELPPAPGVPGGTLAFALRGKGAFQRPMDGGGPLPLRVSAVGPEGPVRFLESVESGHADHGLQGRVKGEITAHPETIRVDSQVKYAVLARGEADVYLRLPSPKSPGYREKIWDHAAGVLIVEEAGGRVTDSRGVPLCFGRGRKLEDNAGVVATNGGLHERVLDGLRRAAGREG